MSEAARPELPIAMIESNRELLERLEKSSLPIARDAERTLAVLDERKSLI
ncbi:hypothetical protein [Natronorarus salvus]